MASVNVDISARIDRRDLRSTQERIEDAMMQTGNTSGNRFREAFNRATRRLDPQTPGSARFTADGRRDGEAYKRGFNEATSKLGDGLGKIAMGSLIAGAPIALEAVAGAAVAASGAIGLLPGVALAAGSAIGTLKIATLGFGDAISNSGDPKKYAEALQSLSPAAQQAALEIKSLTDGPLKQLQQKTQEKLFSGLAEEIHNLGNVFLPTIEKTTTGIAGAFNAMAHGIGNELMKPATFQAISSTVDNIVRSFQNFAPAMAPLTNAFAQIAQAGSSFLPQLATAAANAATRFSEFITNAAQSGKLQQWIQEGITALQQIGSIAWDVGRAFVAFGEEGKKYLPAIADAARNIADTLATHPGLIDAITAAFAIWGGVKVVGAISSVVSGIGGIATALRGLPAVASTAATGISAALARVAIPVWLAWLVGQQNPTIQPNMTDINGQTSPDIRNPNFQFPSSIDGGRPQFNAPGQSDASVPGYNGGSGTSDHGDWQAQTRPNPARRQGLPDFDLNRTYAGPGSPTADLPPWQPSAVPLPPADGGSKGGRKNAVEVPWQQGDPTQLLQGYNVTSSLYSAAQGVLEARQNILQQQAELDAAQKDSNSTQADIQKERNDLIAAQQRLQESELRLDEAKRASVDKFAKSTQDATKQMTDLTSNISFEGGIPGMVSGLVKSLMSIAFAPLMGSLQAIKQANGNEGSGLFGYAAATGAFGDQYTPQAIAAAQQGGRGYGRYPSSGYPGDQALLANVPAGRYSQTGNADLVKGLGDCSSAVEDLVNLLDGRPTSGRSMSTGNAAEWLTSRGFLPGMGGPGDFRVGYNGGHMQATLPNGTPFNWGSDSAAARGGVGGTGADDPSFTSHYYRPATTPMGSTVPHNIYSPANTDPALNNPVPQGGSQYAYGPAGPLPTSFPGGPLGSGMPTATPQYAPQVQPQAAPGWKPSGSNGGGGGLMGMAAAAASSGLNMLAPGAGALAQMGIQAINRTVQFGGEVASELAQGALSSLSISDPDSGGGTDLSTSWVGRLASSMASAAPAIPSSAGAMDKATQQGQQQANPQQPQQGNQQQPGQGGVHIENFVQSPDRQGVQQTANDLAYATYASGMR
jgi:hypothetical protein